MLHTSGEQGSGDNLFGDNPYLSGCPHAKLELVALAKFMLLSILKSVGIGKTNSIYFKICKSDVFAIYETIPETAKLSLHEYMRISEMLDVEYRKHMD